MEYLLIIFGFIGILVGIIGCFLPVLPGPPIAYLSLVCLHFSSSGPVSTNILIIYAALALFVTIIDYIIPIWGTKAKGGTKYGTWGSAIGTIIGLIFFPPFGILIGPFAGAMIGEMIGGKDSDSAMKIGFGAFLGFLAGSFLKLILCLVILYEYISGLL